MRDEEPTCRSAGCVHRRGRGVVRHLRPRGGRRPGPLVTASATVVRACVVEALRRSVDDRGLWLRRFVALDGSAELRTEALAHWVSWADVVAGYVASRTGDSGRSLRSASIGGALQAAFLAVLRGWDTTSRPAHELLGTLDQDLVPLCEVLQGWLDATCGGCARSEG
ncbi:hypothetical protein [Streptomyces sp. MBT62]|uniref:acyl-CoA-like ligand-binding transcription factor n=1 Tax=Streptomyces sp. MBT62 TaxID=2800410 RepID=UPI00190D7B04|nr:hypothetical protein [Streptomyces sp. MBT62]MBK3568546.1 hypothetical protein [Streptomyces sp. MBT62]